MKQHLGDSVYADIDNYGSLVLTTGDGLPTENIIIMEGEVLFNLSQFLEKHYGIKVTSNAPQTSTNS